MNQRAALAFAFAVGAAAVGGACSGDATKGRADAGGGVGPGGASGTSTGTGTGTGTGAGSGSGSGAGAGGARSGTTVGASLALTGDDEQLWVVNADADSVTLIDTAARRAIAEVALGTTPTVDGEGRYEPRYAPRSLAIVGDRKIYVAAQARNAVVVIDAATRAVMTEIAVPAAPVSIAAAPDGGAVFVVSHEAGVVTRIDPAQDVVTTSTAVAEHPWGLAVSADGASVFVTHTLRGPGVTTLDAGTLAIVRTTALADQPPGGDKRIPNGQPRGLYAVAPRPGDGELWVPHMLLATGTAQPDLDFESTVFPTVSTLSADGGAAARRLLFQPAVPGATGAFGDSVSGPHAVAFTPSGKLALVAMAQSEDVLVFDAALGVEVGLVRPLPSALLEGIVVDHEGKRAYVDGRSTHDVTVLAIDEAAANPVVVDGAPIERLAVDPMPATLRRGQRLFYSSNSGEFPLTKDFWVACASCHLEGGSDAVTWLFNAGPRDTPSNAGGTLHTGFLMRQALRSTVDQYDETIRVEQGGSYDLENPAQKADLDALAAFVDLAIPFPENPNLAPGGALTPAQARGKTTFDAACASCHAGAALTDSGAGNPTLDLAGPVLLHDVGTCAQTGQHRDVPSTDRAGDPRTACDFDTPTLRGVFATPPYFHDGSAPTLRAVVDRLPMSASLADADKDDLVAYLLTL